VQNYSFLPSRGPSGGILIAVLDNHFRLICSSRSENALTVNLQMLNDAMEWHLTGVYGPQAETNKLLFLEELKHIKQSIPGKWLIAGDFNMIYRAQYKNNTRVNRRIMGKFKSTIDELQLRELPLHGRKYTWTSEQPTQAEATMSRIDHLFCSTSWEESFPIAHLYAWVSTQSDHYPLILQGETSQERFKGFKFESYLLNIPGFMDIVHSAWHKPLHATNSIRHLHIKLSRTAKALKRWEKTCVGNIKVQLAIVKEAIWQLDQAQENRDLTQSEKEFRTKLKQVHAGLVAFEKIRAKQRARLSNINHGDANTNLFYLRANGRKRKQHIQALQTPEGLVMSHEDKEKEIARHFDLLLDTKQRRSLAINWGDLNYPSFDLADLDADLQEEEVRQAISDMPKDNAPGPDGFIGAFYSKCYEIVRVDAVQAIR
jgi:hypothetical protein